MNKWSRSVYNVLIAVAVSLCLFAGLKTYQSHKIETLPINAYIAKHTDPRPMRYTDLIPAIFSLDQPFNTVEETIIQAGYKNATRAAENQKNPIAYEKSKPISPICTNLFWISVAVSDDFKLKSAKASRYESCL